MLTWYAHTEHLNWHQMPPKNNKQKGLPLRDGDAYGNLGKPPDDPGPAQEQPGHGDNAPSQPTWSCHHKNDDNATNIQLALDEEPDMNQKGMKMANRAQQTQTLLHQGHKSVLLNCASKMTCKIVCNPEPQLRMNSSDVDRIVMAISSLSFTINEACKSEWKSHENEQRTHKSKLKTLIELDDSTKTQAAGAHKHEDAILNSIEKLGMITMEAINSEVTAMLNHANVLN